MAYETTGTLPIISCGVGDEVYGLDMRFVGGTLRTDEMRQENTGTDIVGWVRGASGGNVPVYSLARRLGRMDNPGQDEMRRVILLQTKQGQWGLLVDHVSQVWSVQMDRVQLMPAILEASAPLCFSHVINAPDAFLLMLAPERFHSYSSQINQSSNFNLTSSSFLTVTADSQAKVQTEPGRLLLFLVGEYPMQEREIVFGLSVTQVPEVLKLPSLLPVPSAPSLVLGLINWRNRPVPVIDIAARFGLPPMSVNEDHRLLICRVSGDKELVGILARSTMRMMRLPVQNEPCNRELTFNPSWCKTVVELSDETLVIPDVQQLLSSHCSLV